MTLRRQEPVHTWEEIKLKLQKKYFLVLYQKCLLDQWQRLTQGNQSVAEHITRFNEFLVKCGENESGTIVLSIFHSGLKEDLRRELFKRYISTLEHVYHLV